MKLVIIYFLSFINFSFSQNEKIISGKIICDNNAISGIQITNLVNEKSTTSAVDGKFAILAKPEDMLVFTSINYEYKRKFLENEDFNSNDLLIILTKKIEQLEEVTVFKSPKFDAFEMGILEKPAKEYTVAERRLKNAGEFKPNIGTLMSLPIEPIINAISGRTKNLKNQLKIERNEILLAKVINLYNHEYYTKKLKINPDLIKAFQYYVIYDFQFLAVLKSKNKNKIDFKMVELASKFNSIQTIEK